MPKRYELANNIERVEEAVRCEGLLEQREITVQTYRTTQPFDAQRLENGVRGSWLSPAMRLGVFSRGAANGQSNSPVSQQTPQAASANGGCADQDDLSTAAVERMSVVAVLGLLDSLTLRAYDYDERKPLWFRWRDLVVETMHVRYSSKDGLLRYTTSGGGRRISEKRLSEFNRDRMGIRDTDVVKEQFNPERLRELCFGRFLERLYSVRFSGQKGEEYRSIDHAAFKSRDYIDPGAERMGEIIKEKSLRVEEFESDVEIGSLDLAKQVRVRFTVRASGSVRMQFPASMAFRESCETAAEQAEAFYGLVDLVMESIFEGKDFFAYDAERLEELDEGHCVLPGLENAAKFERVMAVKEERQRFLKGLRVGQPAHEWRPHLHALNSLAVADGVAGDLCRSCRTLAERAPATAAWLLDQCRADVQATRVGTAVAAGIVKGVNAVASEDRGMLDVALLAWHVDHAGVDLWSVDAESSRVAVGEWRIEHDATGALKARVLGFLFESLHGRLLSSPRNAAPLLRDFKWCVDKARSLDSDASDCPTGVRMLSDGKDKLCTGDGSRVLAHPVSSTEALDDQVWRELRLPLWPVLRAVRKPDGRTMVVNDGIGTALGVRIGQTGELLLLTTGQEGSDLKPGGELPAAGSAGTVDIRFKKFGKEHLVTLDVADEDVSTETANVMHGALRQEDSEWDAVYLHGEHISLRKREKAKAFLRYLWQQGATRASTAVDVHVQFPKPSSLFGAGERVEQDRGGAQGRDATVQSELGAKIHLVFIEGIGLVPPPKKGQGQTKYYLKVYRDSTTT